MTLENIPLPQTPFPFNPCITYIGKTAILDETNQFLSIYNEASVHC